MQKSNKFMICRLVSKSWVRGATIEVVQGWGAATMAIAASLARVASETFGGEFAFACDGEEFTVWIGFQSSDFATKVAPRKVAKKAAKKAPVRKVASRKRKAS